MSLGAKKGASDIHLEPTQVDLSIKLRIDGLFYKVKPLRRTALPPMLQRIYELFNLDGLREDVPQ